jgi:hypothetical protein
MKIKQTVTITVNTMDSTWHDVEILCSIHASLEDLRKQVAKELEIDPDTITSLVVVWVTDSE